MTPLRSTVRAPTRPPRPLLVSCADPPVTWGALVIAVPAGALVGIGSGLLVVIVWKWQPVRAQ